MPRPSFINAWAVFVEINKPVRDVGNIIGGKVKVNIDLPENQGGWTNACPVRMSYVLNKTGFPISRGGDYETSSGGDRMWYIFRVVDMMKYLRRTFGAPDKEVKTMPTPAHFAGMKGILVVEGGGWRGATGHVTLWDGRECSDSCHLAYNPDNGSFTPISAALWILP